MSNSSILGGNPPIYHAAGGGQEKFFDKFGSSSKLVERYFLLGGEDSLLIMWSPMGSDEPMVKPAKKQNKTKEECSNEESLSVYGPVGFGCELGGICW